MSVQLLDKTRKIGRMLHNSEADETIFEELCEVTGEILSSNAVIVGRDGTVLGMERTRAEILSGGMLPQEAGEPVAEILNERFFSILSTKENVNLMTLGFSVADSRKYKAMLIPFDIAGERVGTMLLYRSGEEYEIDDIILAEYVATIAGLEMQQATKEEASKKEQRRQAARAAIRLLSFAELEAIKAVFEELGDKPECLLVISHVAEKSGITRSVILNALRKFESSGILEVRSLGVKGTKIRVSNEVIYRELAAL